MALVIAMAVTTGFRNQLQRSLLGAMAHINVVPKVPGEGIEDWRSLMARLRAAPHVTAAAPALYSPVLMVGAVNSKAGILKGIDVDSELAISDDVAPFEGRLARPAARSRRQSSRHRPRQAPGGGYRHPRPTTASRCCLPKAAR